jgi:hypothetical protein
MQALWQRSKDNNLVVPSGFINQAQLTAEINRAIEKLDFHEVAGVMFSLGSDSTGTPALFFRVVLHDAASREDRLEEVTGRAATTLSIQFAHLKIGGSRHIPASAVLLSRESAVIRSGNS